MKVRCIENTGDFLEKYEYTSTHSDNTIGRFGSTRNTVFNEIGVGSEYTVMAIIVFQTYQAFLIDDNGFVCTCPCQLFEVIDNQIPTNWKFRLIDKTEHAYPFIQAVFGFPELCTDIDYYEKLIVEKDKDAELIYFKSKLEFEKYDEWT